MICIAVHCIIKVSDPGPSWPSCFFFWFLPISRASVPYAVLLFLFSISRASVPYAVLLLYDVMHLFSSPEHVVLKVSYCDRLLSVVRRPSSTFACYYSRGNILHPIFMKVYQNIISPSTLGQFRNWVMWGKNLGH